MRSLITVIAAVVAAPALAGTPCTDLVPPEVYRYEPTVEYQVIRVEKHELPDVCGPLLPIYACAVQGGGMIPTIYLVEDNYFPHPSYEACLLTHEKAHINGWPGTHPAY